MNTRLLALAGYASPAAYASAGSIFVFLSIQTFGNVIAPPTSPLFVPLVILFDLALWLWIVGLALVGRDLARLAHPTTSLPGIRVARWAILVALVMPIGVYIGQAVSQMVLMPIAYCLIFGGVGISLLLHNLGARRAGMLHGVLPWLGVVAGVACIVGGIGFGMLLVPNVGMMIFPICLNIQELGEAVYVIWAIWIGLRLGRSHSMAAATA